MQFSESTEQACCREEGIADPRPNVRLNRISARSNDDRAQLARILAIEAGASPAMRLYLQCRADVSLTKWDVSELNPLSDVPLDVTLCDAERAAFAPGSALAVGVTRDV